MDDEFPSCTQIYTDLAQSSRDLANKAADQGDDDTASNMYEQADVCQQIADDRGGK